MEEIEGTVPSGPYLIAGIVNTVYFASVLAYGETINAKGFGPYADKLRTEENKWQIVIGYRVILPVFMGLPSLWFLLTIISPNMFRIGGNLMSALTWFSLHFFSLLGSFWDDAELGILSMVYYPDGDFAVWENLPAHAGLFWTKASLWTGYVPRNLNRVN